MAALSVIGLACLPRLNIQYTPTQEGRSISVSYALADASAEIIEAEATSRIEGVLNGIRGVTELGSVSRKGSGSVTVTFRKGTDMDAARFEVASAIRNIYGSLPKGLSYPDIRFSSGGASTTAISYIIKGALPSQEIERYASDHILTPISALKGVDGVSLSGATPYHWVITFDAAKAASAGISAADIADAIRETYAHTLIGMTDTPDGKMAVRLSGDGNPDFGAIIVRSSGGTLLRLADMATWRYEESLPKSYYRVNGLNTITLSVDVSSESNLISTVRAIKKEMSRLQALFPGEITASVAYDASEFVEAELERIYLRTGLCILILLVFVFLVSRSWRYLFIITATLAVNILTALAIYALLGLQIHIYTLAGITVSLGIIIDGSIVMADHYGYWKDRKAFPALLAATLTTVGALLLVLLLPESERQNLSDFIIVVVVNLSLSLLIAYLFIPSLMALLPVRRRDATRRLAARRRAVRMNALYGRYIDWGVRHRWVLVMVLVLAFGIPTCLLPSGSSANYDGDSTDRSRNIFEKIAAWGPYARNRGDIDRWLGASFARFYKALDRSNFYRMPARKQLYIRAGMLEGCTVAQLNEVVKSMENYLAGFDEIEVFTTSVYSYNNATIVVEFKPEYEKTAFPQILKSQVTSMAINFGGANWSVFGIDDNFFNNNIVSTSKSYRISLSGYNYQELRRYADRLVERLSENQRISEPEVWSSGWNGRGAMEFNLDYDFGAMTAAGINPYRYYGVLSSLLFDETVGSVPSAGGPVEVVLRSSDSESYDLWHVLNAPVSVDSLKMTLSSVGNIVKKRSGIDIRKTNQSYQLDVCFDFIGSYALARKAISQAVDYMNEAVLPLGYKAENPQGGWYDTHKDRYAWLIFLIIGLIFVMLSISFESLRLPLAVILMIPVSFIGLFLVFGSSRISFDQGGFAAFVMLCGIVVNAGIYILTAFQRFGGCGAASTRLRIRRYIKAFSHKIGPVALTVLSTILGLLPFLSDGPEEVFWFDFAAGTIGGLLFSVIALLFYLPVFSVRSVRDGALPGSWR